MREIVIREGADDKPPAPPESKFDVQDGLLAAGILFAEASAYVIWKPATLILAAVFCLGFAYLIERSRRRVIRPKR